MKSLTFLLAGALLVAMTSRTYAQDVGSKPLNNPMYSTHNYKHPNMAAAARRSENKTGVAVQQPTPTDARMANYKNQMPNRQPVGGVTVDHTPSASLADRNYKIQRVSEPQSFESAAGEYYVRKRSKDSSATTVGQ
ncbi:hypothetical protein BH09BAC4_BH09BAC4_52440 [soil metagenome]